MVVYVDINIFTYIAANVQYLFFFKPISLEELESHIFDVSRISGLSDYHTIAIVNRNDSTCSHSIDCSCRTGTSRFSP